MTAASRILDRLQRPKQTRPGRWMAACPCCESRKGRPLAVTEADDGRVLLHAFCGCSTEDVLGRIGLSITDLYDQPLTHAVKPIANRVSAAEVLDGLSEEVTVLVMLVEHYKLACTEACADRLALAARRIGLARDYIHDRQK